MKRLLLFVIAAMAAAMGCAQSNAPLCFTARNGSVTVEFNIKNITHTIQYSTDGSTWNTYVSDRSMSLSANQSIYFRAATNQTTATPFAYIDAQTNAIYNSHFAFFTGNGGTVEGSGNIMSLYGPDCPDLPLQDFAFYGLFQGCILLTTAPALPATTLADTCYGYMFGSCRSLTVAPSLPATTLAKSCYSRMFQGCSSLVTPPALPAMTLTEECYDQMFQGCTSLATAPDLPATTLAEDCCFCMFKDCSSLVTPPALPATTLAEDCYVQMFEGCTSLTTAPVLPATTLASGCYSSMFYGCSSLTTLPALPADSLVEYCYTYMFADCASLVVNKAAPGKPWMIPTTTTADYALYLMFGNTGGTMKSTPNVNTTYYIASAPQYSVTVNVNDSTMGNVTGGGTTFYEGDTATLTATPNAGYEFDCWSNGEKSQTISIVVVSDTVMSASFKIKTGVEDVMDNKFVVYSEKSNIVVSGAMGKKVSVYDVNGRLVAETPNANETHEFAVGMTGIYMVCIDDRNTLKVIVE